jgi:transcriptional regulator with XRE-family HTH domain
MAVNRGKTVGSVLRAFRVMADLDVNYVAGKIGRSDETLRRWERDANSPTYEDLRGLREIYGDFFSFLP